MKIRGDEMIIVLNGIHVILTLWFTIRIYRLAKDDHYQSGSYPRKDREITRDRIGYFAWLIFFIFVLFIYPLREVTVPILIPMEIVIVWNAYQYYKNSKQSKPLGLAVFNFLLVGFIAILNLDAPSIFKAFQ